jgi:hypothetical protein
MLNSMTSPLEPRLPIVAPEFTEESLSRLARVFGLDPTAPDLATKLEPSLALLAEAALQEYVLAFAGVNAPGTIRALRELRLCLLYERKVDGWPSDAQVAQLFQLTRTQTRTLIASTHARYRAELDSMFQAQVVAAIRSATTAGDRTGRIVLHSSLAQYVGDLIEETQAPPLEKRKDAANTYDIKRSTAAELGKRLGFTLDDIPAFG